MLALPGRDRVATNDDGSETVVPSERTVQMRALETEFPYLAEKLTALQKTYADYEVLRTGLDDPEDLKRLLSGSGVLDFRIAVSPSDPPRREPRGHA